MEKSFETLLKNFADSEARKMSVKVDMLDRLAVDELLSVLSLEGEWRVRASSDKAILMIRKHHAPSDNRPGRPPLFPALMKIGVGQMLRLPLITYPDNRPMNAINALMRKTGWHLQTKGRAAPSTDDERTQGIHGWVEVTRLPDET